MIRAIHLIFRMGPRTLGGIHFSILTLALSLISSGCAYKPLAQKAPEISVATGWKELPGWTQANPDTLANTGPWWEGFNDPLLDELEPLVQVSNQTVMQSYANYQQALAQIQAARSGLYPTIGVNTSGTRSRTGVSLPTGGRSAIVMNSGSLEGSASWAPDLWGQIRQHIQQSSQSALASQASLASATLSQQTALATAVINLRIADANIELLGHSVEAYKNYLRVVQNRDEAGIAAPSDVITARTQLQTTQASLIALGVGRAQYEHAIAVLVGRTPEEMSIPHSKIVPTVPYIPVGVPSEVLQRRPDIAVAERQMAAANEAIGIAQAAYYPSISLSAMSGFAASPLAGLLRISNYVWSLGATAVETIFDGGARSAQVQISRANYDGAVSNYRATVLNAFEQVENDLSSLRILNEQYQSLDAAVQEAISGTQIVQNQYEIGTVDYTSVVTAQTTQLNAQQSRLNVRQQQLQSAISLIGNLGGGWKGLEPPQQKK